MLHFHYSTKNGFRQPKDTKEPIKYSVYLFIILDFFSQFDTLPPPDIR